MICQPLAPSLDICPTQAEIVGQLLLELPRGRAFNTHNGLPTPDTTIWKFWNAVADVFAWVNAQICALRPEFFCFSANQTLDLWNAEYGLPDPCDPYANLCAKVAALGGDTCAFYAAVAADLGWSISCATGSCSPGVGMLEAGMAVGSGALPGVLAVIVDIDNSPAYVATPQSIGAVAGFLEAGMEPACGLDLTSLDCVLQRIVHAEVEITYAIAPADPPGWTIAESLAAGFAVDLGAVAAPFDFAEDFGAVTGAPSGAIDLGGLAVTNTLLLTRNNRIPQGVVLDFGDAAEVAAYFGASDAEDVLLGALATQYYSQGATARLKIVRYPDEGGRARVYGAPVALTLAALQAISGTLAVVSDGYAYSATIDLAAATGFVNAAALIEAAFNGALPVAAVCPASSIAPVSFACTGSVSGSTATLTAAGGTVYPGAALTFAGAIAKQQVMNQLTPLLPGEAPGGVGRYAIAFSQGAAGIAPGTAMTVSYGALTLGSVASGQPAVGLTVAGTTAFSTSASAGAGAVIYANADPDPGAASLSWIVDAAQTVASASLTLTGTPLNFIWDATSGAFWLVSADAGIPYGQTLAFPTGTAAAPLGLAEISGAALSTPASLRPVTAPFMAGVLAIDADWAAFQTVDVLDSNFARPFGALGPQQAEFAAWAATQNGAHPYLPLTGATLPGP